MFLEFVIQLQLTDQFSLDIVPELWNAVTENLVKSPDWNVRNFTKDNIETILIKFPKFMEIFFSEKFIKQGINKLTLDLGWKQFETNFIERKIHGLKLIQDILKVVK